MGDHKFKEYVQWIISAKKSETRERRLKHSIDKLYQGTIGVA
ncbi:MAG: YdeI/OmpD-associated family protein [Bacillota bacterium]